MKTNHFSVRYGAFTLVTACFLSVSVLQAQTFTGQDKLSATPGEIEASIYPIINNPATIRVSFNNPSAGGVRVVIRDERGHVVYEQLEKVALYRRRFDLSAMPAGNYTLELSKRSDRFTKAFTIVPPSSGFITMDTPPVHKTPEQPVDKKLIVSY